MYTPRHDINRVMVAQVHELITSVTGSVSRHVYVTPGTRKCVTFDKSKAKRHARRPAYTERTILKCTLKTDLRIWTGLLIVQGDCEAVIHFGYQI